MPPRVLDVKRRLIDIYGNKPGYELYKLPKVREARHHVSSVVPLLVILPKECPLIWTERLCSTGVFGPL